MNPYVIRFVSFARKSGKTSLASQIVAKLKSRGYIVGVIKHSYDEIDVADKDSYVYSNAGADVVVVSAPSKGAVFYSKWVDDLSHIVRYLTTPIVVVEGFRDSSMGDSVAIVNKAEEIGSIKSLKNLIAVVASEELADALRGKHEFKVFTKSDVDELANLVEDKAISYIESQTPKLNCGYCGFESCRTFAKAFAMGKTGWCPVKLDVKLIVNDRNVPLNPFVKNALRSTIEGFISSLKGVEDNRRRIVIEINLD
ncbi:MAG: molybdopterin-guanine dinucleotide biosynthesis protein B [Ignisphaera sp.]